MANEESPVLQDILLHPILMECNNNEDSLLSIDFKDIDPSCDFDSFFSSFDILNDFEEEKTISADQSVVPNSSFDFPPSISASPQQHIVPSNSPSIDVKHQPDISLSFINPPEPVYHVRYVSEITNVPLNGNVVNTRIKTKKNISGRYLKGIRGRYVTIALPSTLSDHSNLFIRVTRLTVPYQDISYIHPYPLLYSYPKKKMHSPIIIQKGSSIYYKINKEEICSHTKHLPNLILPRLKQCQLKQINNLYSFDNNGRSCPFIENNVKNKIAIYQLKKSQLDFRLAIKCEQKEEFVDTNIFCRSNALLEEEGIEWKKSST